jgi:hypothetical protein
LFFRLEGDMSTSPIQEEVNSDENRERDAGEQHLRWRDLIGDAKELFPIWIGLITVK